MERYLFNSSFKSFLEKKPDEVFGQLCQNYHGDALTTTRDAWYGEIAIMQSALKDYQDTDGQSIFEYDIPRLGKRIDVVLLLKGIIFCL